MIILAGLTSAGHVAGIMVRVGCILVSIADGHNRLTWILGSRNSCHACKRRSSSRLRGPFTKARPL